MSHTRWLITSVAVGVVVALLRLIAEPGAGLPTISQRDFEKGIAAGRKKEGSLSDVTVLPERDGKTKVVARELYRDGPAPGAPLASRRVALIAEKPYRADIWEGNATEFPDVAAYLDMVLSGKGTKGFRYAWWDEDWAIYVSSVGASVLLLGIVLPATLDFLHRRRFGPSGEGAAVSLAGVRATGRASATARSASELTEEERERLAELNARLEESAVTGTAAGVARSASQVGLAPRPLEGAAGAEQPRSGDAGDPAAPEYQGEFYPVAKPHQPRLCDDASAGDDHAGERQGRS